MLVRRTQTVWLPESPCSRYSTGYGPVPVSGMITVTDVCFISAVWAPV